MEDDVVAKPGYLNIMKTFALQQKDEWIMLEFSALGFIGMYYLMNFFFISKECFCQPNIK